MEVQLLLELWCQTGGCERSRSHTCYMASVSVQTGFPFLIQRLGRGREASKIPGSPNPFQQRGLFKENSTAPCVVFIPPPLLHPFQWIFQWQERIQSLLSNNVCGGFPECSNTALCMHVTIFDPSTGLKASICNWMFQLYITVRRLQNMTASRCMNRLIRLFRLCSTADA